MDRNQGILAPEFYQRIALFAADLKLSKADLLRTCEAAVSHAMTLVGVDLVDDQPTKWKVENSWGEKNGDQGYFVMSDRWFDEYVYEVIVRKEFLASKETAMLQQKPIDLKPWDSLA